jgi:hypothetical protein
LQEKEERLEVVCIARSFASSAAALGRSRGRRRIGGSEGKLVLGMGGFVWEGIGVGMSDRGALGSL